MVSFGGASALFAADICRGVGIPRIVIPEFASVFSAWGLLRADPIRTEARSVQWLPEVDPLHVLNDALAEITAQATSNMLSRGFAAEDIDLQHTVDMRFSGQSFDVPVTLWKTVFGEEDRADLLRAFHDAYAEFYGVGSIWEGFPPLVSTVRVVAKARREKATPARVAGSDVESRAVDQRRVYDLETKVWDLVPVYETGSMAPGQSIPGPCIVENIDTTIHVPRNASITRATAFRGFDLILAPSPSI